MIFNGIAVQTDNQKCLIFTGGNTDPPDQCQFTVRLPDDCRVSLQGSPCTPVISQGFAPFVQDKILLIMNMLGILKVWIVGINLNAGNGCCILKISLECPLQSRKLFLDTGIQSFCRKQTQTLITVKQGIGR